MPHLFAAYASQAETADYSTEYDIELDGTVYITNGVWYIEDEKVNRCGGGGGTSDYTELDNKPQINSVTLAGNKSASDLGLAAASDLTGKADKATTLAGYGITDAKIVSGTITLGSQSITPLTQHQDLSGIEDALAEVIDGGAKNLIPFDLEAMKTGNSSAGYTWNGNVCTISDGSSLNIVITVGTDGVITATGSKPATSSGLNFRIVPAAEAYDLPLGDYVLSGCPAGGSSATYQLRALINSSSVFAQDTGSGAEFTTRGEIGNGSDRAGHVAVVEIVNQSGSIVTSESGWNSNKEFWTTTRKNDGNWGQSSAYRFIGFINPPTAAMRVLKKGDQGDDVRRLKTALTDAGYDLGKIVGDFGIRTQRAVVCFQFEHSLEVDGICGPKTRAALGI